MLIESKLYFILVDINSSTKSKPKYLKFEYRNNELLKGSIDFGYTPLIIEGQIPKIIMNEDSYSDSVFQILYGRIVQWQLRGTVNPLPPGFVGSSPTAPT